MSIEDHKIYFEGFLPGNERYGSFLQSTGLHDTICLGWRYQKFVYGGMDITKHEVDYGSTPH